MLYASGTDAQRREAFNIPVADGGGSTPFTCRSVRSSRCSPRRQFSAWNMKVGITDAQGQPVWKNNEVWISNDARRLPVKLQAELPVGHFVLVLRDISPR